jgi:AmmeMemoRadiSam system protein A
VTSEHPLVQLARRTIESYVRDGQVLQSSRSLGEIGERRAGAFVSLHLNGALRGCIGTIECVQTDLEREIIQNAISAATRDPRFRSVCVEELDGLEISVDVLGDPEQIEDMSLLDPQRYGVIVERGTQRGLLLPALEGVDTAEYQVSIALSKAGIAPNENYRLYRFQVDRYH